MSDKFLKTFFLKKKYILAQTANFEIVMVQKLSENFKNVGNIFTKITQAT